MVTKKESFFRTKDESPLLIAGPCSAESYEQVLETSRELATIPGLFGLRAGIWKPRTRPGSFEGIGEQALPWLVAAGKDLGLPVAAEVAKTEHVEACLKAGVSILWVGARTTVNPIYVQELAEAMRGADVNVLVKNPIHPEINLWIGALERFEQVGIDSIGAVHRGYFSLAASPYRNEAGWELAVELRERVPEVPIICDPSHIAGKRALVPEVCQIALDLGLDGLMIESHINPERALSDADQQLTPKRLKEVIANLTIRHQIKGGVEASMELQRLRAEIDGVDNELIRMVAKRLEIIREIANEKDKHNLAIFQLKRWMEIVETRKDVALENKLSPNMIHELFRVIHKNALEEQVRILNKRNSD
jgi:chorismate mutase